MVMFIEREREIDRTGITVFCKCTEAFFGWLASWVDGCRFRFVHVMLRVRVREYAYRGVKGKARWTDGENMYT